MGGSPKKERGGVLKKDTKIGGWPQDKRYWDDFRVGGKIPQKPQAGSLHYPGAKKK